MYQMDSRTPVTLGMELLRNVNALYQNRMIVQSEKDYMAEQIKAGMTSGDFSLLREYLVYRVARMEGRNSFMEKMKELLEKEE